MRDEGWGMGDGIEEWGMGNGKWDGRWRQGIGMAAGCVGGAGYWGWGAGHVGSGCGIPSPHMASSYLAWIWRELS